MFVPPESRRAFATLRISSSFTSLTSSTSRSLVHAQQAPQPLSSHTLTSQFPVHRGWRSVAQASACALSSPQPKSTPASAPPDPFDDSPLVCPASESVRSPSSTRSAHLDTQKPPQLLSRHSFAHNFRHIGGYTPQPTILFCRRLATRHSSLATISFRIRTSEKHTDNPFRIRTSKTQDLKRLC